MGVAQALEFEGHIKNMRRLQARPCAKQYPVAERIAVQVSWHVVGAAKKKHMEQASKWYG